jgi:pimeloyl-ACP methyl ester carboxylesterase
METIIKHEKLQSNWTDTSPERPRTPSALLPYVRFGFQTLGRLFPRAASKVAFRLFTTPQMRAKHRTSDEILESARIFEVLYGKRILKAYEWGSGDRTILLVHGWESRGTAMRSFVPGLVARGYRVVAFDGPAHGNSEGKRTNLPHFAGAVKAMIKRLGDVHGIITHSFGGASTVYALSWMESDVRVEKLVMIAVPANMQRIFKTTVQTLKLPPRSPACSFGIWKPLPAENWRRSIVLPPGSASAYKQG